MCSKLHNEDKDNIDQDSDVYAIGLCNRITARRTTKTNIAPKLKRGHYACSLETKNWNICF